MITRDLGDYFSNFASLSVPAGTPFTNMDYIRLIPAWMNNFMSGKAEGEITSPFPNFISCTVEFRE